MKKRILTILLAFVMTLSFLPMLSNVEKVYAASNPYPGNMNSNCTYAAWQKTKDILGIELPSWGNAWQWYSGAQNAGYSVGTTPRANSIVVFKQASWNGNYGHVAFVSDYNASTGKIYKMEGNYNGSYHEGWAPAWESDMYGYIYLNGAPANHNPTIAFDGVEVKPGQVRVTGWAFDPDDPTRSIDVHAYLFVNGNPTCIGGTTANKSRKDVDNAYHVGEFHGFDATFDTNIVGGAEAQVAAINIGEGSNVWSDKKQISVPNPNPVGYIDSVTDNGSSIKVTGWAFDPSDTSKQIELHVYIGGSSGSSGAEGHNGIIANLERKDVNKAYKCGDYHGFSAIIPTNKLGSQQVYIYGINIGPGWDNTCFGSKTVTITKHSHSLVKTPAKAATTSAEGNIEYWTCSGCGKIFKDSAGKTEISKADTVVPKLTPAKTSATPQSTVKTDLPAVTITSAKSAKKAAVVRWKKVSKKNQKKIAKIQIQYSTDKKFKKSVKTVSATKSATYKKIKKLKSKKQYYFRVRSYKKAGNVTHVSKWSKVKKAKIK